METINVVPTENEQRRRCVTELSADEARQFFLKQESYCTIDLPPYFTFNDILSDVARLINGKSLSNFRDSKVRDLDHVNHLVLNNKDGRYSWRPLELAARPRNTVDEVVGV